MALCNDCGIEVQPSEHRCVDCRDRHKQFMQLHRAGVRRGNVFASLTPEAVDWLGDLASKHGVDMSTVVVAIVSDAYHDEHEGLSCAWKHMLRSNAEALQHSTRDPRGGNILPQDSGQS